MAISTPEMPNEKPELPKSGSAEMLQQEAVQPNSSFDSLNQGDLDNLFNSRDDGSKVFGDVAISDAKSNTALSDNSANSLPITDSRVIAALDKDDQIAQIDTVDKAEAALAEQIKTIRGIENAVNATQDKQVVAEAGNRAAIVKEMDDSLS